MKPKLNKYRNKKVKITSKEGQIYIGKVEQYTPAHDNDGEEALALDIGIWLDESDIKNIQIVNKNAL